MNCKIVSRHCVPLTLVTTVDDVEGSSGTMKNTVWVTPKRLEPIFAFLATDRPFAEVSRLTVVSKNWRTVVHKALKTAPQVNLSGFAESVRDEDVRLAFVRLTSENLKRVDLTCC